MIGMNLIHLKQTFKSFFSFFSKILILQKGKKHWKHPWF